MGIIKNNKNVIAIYRGDKKITSVFKNNNKLFGSSSKNIFVYKSTSANQSVTIASNASLFKRVHLVEENVDLEVGGYNSLSYTYANTGEHNVEIEFNETATDLIGAFRECITLVRAELSIISESLTDLNSMFDECKGLISITFNEINAPNVLSLKNFLSGCILLTNVTFKSINLPKLNTIYVMFTGDKELVTLDLSLLDTSNVNNFAYLFSGCTSLTTLYMDKFNGYKVTSSTNRHNMFNRTNIPINYIRCTQTFKNWCWSYQSDISLPNTMRSGGSGTWEIIS